MESFLEAHQAGRVIDHDVRGVGCGIAVGQTDPFGAHVGQIVDLCMGLCNEKCTENSQNDQKTFQEHGKPPFLWDDSLSLWKNHPGAHPLKPGKTGTNTHRAIPAPVLSFLG